MAEIVLLGEVQDIAALPALRRRRPLLGGWRRRPAGKRSQRRPVAGPRPGGPTRMRGLLRSQVARRDEGLGMVKPLGKLPKLPKLMKPGAPPPGPSAGDLALGAQLAAEMDLARATPMPVQGMAVAPPPALLDRVSGGLQQGTSWVERLGGQVVNVLDAGARLKQATAMQKWQVNQAWDRFQGQSWFDLELIPGVKNLYLVLGAGGLLAVLLMNRGK